MISFISRVNRISIARSGHRLKNRPEYILWNFTGSFFIVTTTLNSSIFILIFHFEGDMFLNWIWFILIISTFLHETGTNSVSDGCFYLPKSLFLYIWMLQYHEIGLHVAIKVLRLNVCLSFNSIWRVCVIYSF